MDVCDAGFSTASDGVHVAVIQTTADKEDVRSSCKNTVSLQNTQMVQITKLLSHNNQKAAIALEPLTTHPDEWVEPSHK